MHHKLNAKVLHAEKQHKKPCAAELHAKKLKKTILKQPTNKLLELLLYFFPSTQGVSKVANTQEVVNPEKKKKKPSTKP